MNYKKFTTLNQDIVRIRTDVFIEEQGFKNEFDAIDNNCSHIVLYDEDNPAAVCRYFEIDGVYHIGRFAIVREYRGRGLGSMLLKIAEEEIKKDGGISAVVSAQVRVKQFYIKNGFKECGDTYFDEYCEHVDMKKQL